MDPTGCDSDRLPEGTPMPDRRLVRGAIVWGASSILALAVVAVAKRVAEVFAGQGAFATADLMQSLPPSGVWAALSLTMLVLVLLAFARVGALARATLVAAFACAGLLLLLAAAFICVPFVQWALWLRSVP